MSVGDIVIRRVEDDAGPPQLAVGVLQLAEPWPSEAKMSRLLLETADRRFIYPSGESPHGPAFVNVVLENAWATYYVTGAEEGPEGGLLLLEFTEGDPEVGEAPS